MADPAPGGLTGPFHRDLEGRSVEVVTRRVILALLTLFVIAGLLSFFGQKPVLTSASGAGATLTVETPDTVRGGLLYQTKLSVQAPRAGVKEPKLVLSRGFMDGLTLNTLEPSPVDEKSVDGNLVLSFPPQEPGDILTVWLDYQVNPTTIGAREQRVTLRDGEQPLATVTRQLKVFP